MCLLSSSKFHKYSQFRLDCVYFRAVKVPLRWLPQHELRLWDGRRLPVCMGAQRWRDEAPQRVRKVLTAVNRYLLNPNKKMCSSSKSSENEIIILLHSFVRVFSCIDKKSYFRPEFEFPMQCKEERVKCCNHDDFCNRVASDNGTRCSVSRIVSMSFVKFFSSFFL